MSPSLPPDGADVETVLAPYPLYPDVGLTVTPEPKVPDVVIPFEPVIAVVLSTFSVSNSLIAA